MSAAKQRRCMTCGQKFAEGDANVFLELKAFEDICICQHCVKVARKEVAPDPNSRE